MAVEVRRRYPLRLPEDLAKVVEAEAKRNNVSINSYLTAAADLAVSKGLTFFHDTKTTPELPPGSSIPPELRAQLEAAKQKALNPTPAPAVKKKSPAKKTAKAPAKKARAAR